MAAEVSISIRPYRAQDEDDLLRVWNEALVADPINAATWRSKVLLDPNFDPEGCLVAEVEGEVAGFLLSIKRKVPFFNDGLQPEQAWITAFAVAPSWQGKGLGRKLLEAALERLRALGTRSVAISPYVPYYFTPGIDVHAYGRAVDWLVKDGWQVIERPLSMRAELTGFQIPNHIRETEDRLRAEGIVVREVEPRDIVPVLAFVQQHFTWDWHREASGVLGDLFAGDPRTVGMVIACRDDEVIGYAEHRAERFGPFGVHPNMRSRGIGRVLLAHMLLEMRKQGYHAAWFLWTGDYAAKLYSQCGFHEVRRFAVLKKDI